MNEDKPKTADAVSAASIIGVLTEILAALNSLNEPETKSPEPAKTKPEMLGETFKDSKWVSLFTKTYKKKPKAEQDNNATTEAKDKKEKNATPTKKDKASADGNAAQSNTTPNAKDPYLSSLEKYKGISADLGGVFSSIAASAKSVKGNVEQMFGAMDSSTEAIVDDSINLVGGLGDAFSGMATMDFGKMISGTMQVAQSVLSLFDWRARNANARIAEAEESLKLTKIEQRDLEKSTTNKYSDDSFKALNKVAVNLEDQRKLVEEQQSAESSKKLSDHDKIREYEKAQADLQKEIDATKAKAVDAVFGSDLQSAINDFAKAYMDAFTSGGSAASAQKDIVKNMITGIVTEMIKSDIAGKVKEIREKIAALLEDGDLSESDLKEITTLANDAGKEVNAKSDNYTKILDSVGATDDKNDVSLAGQIRGTVATEASVAELGGLFRSQADSLIQINNKMTLGVQDISSIAKSSLLIEINTRQTATNTQTTNAVLGDIKTELSTIRKNTSKDNGIYGR